MSSVGGPPPPKRQRTVLEDALDAPDPVSKAHAAVDAVVSRRSQFSWPFRHAAALTRIGSPSSCSPSTQPTATPQLVAFMDVMQREWSPQPLAPAHPHGKQRKFITNSRARDTLHYHSTRVVGGSSSVDSRLGASRRGRSLGLRDGQKAED